MLDGSLAWLLTAVFAATGLFCLATWTGHSVDHPAAGDSRLVHATHALMSVAMVVMVWRPAGAVGTWVQVAVFAVLGLALAVAALRATGMVARIDWITHLALDAAMIWMLAAMPLLMGTTGSVMGSPASTGHHHGHHDGGTGAAPMPATGTPAWVDAASVVAIVACIMAMLWWAGRTLTSRGQRLHGLCHALMAAGTAIMLGAMGR